MRTAALSLCLIVCACASSPAPVPLVLETDAYALHSDPWINVHHFLYQWARGQVSRQPNDRRPPVEVAEVSEFSMLTPDQRDAWAAALEHYRDLVDKDLLFDEDMEALKEALAAIDGPESIAALDSAALLEAAREVFVDRWWPKHDGANRAWIQAMRPMLEKYEGRLVHELERAYGGTWPEYAIRTDVTYYANWAGAYTSWRPDHIVLSSGGDEHQGVAGLEILVHEASHSESLGSPLHEELDRLFEEAGARAPFNLWHVFYFVTAGELTRRVLAEEGIDDYVPYGERVGLYRRTRWDGMHAVLLEHWVPFLRGELERDEALRRIVAVLASD